MSHRVLDEEMSEASSSREELHKTAKTDWQEVLLVPLGFVAFVVICGLDKVFLYRVHKIMADYTAVLMGIYWPPMLQAMCAVVSLGYVWRQRLVTKDPSYSLAWFSPWSEKASSQGAVPQLWIALFALWDMVNAVLAAPPSPFIPMVLQQPLNNMLVLWTALIAFFYLNTRFKQVHYAGICLILCSCLVGVLVELQGPAPKICAGLDTGQETLSNPALPVPDATRWLVGNASDECASGLPQYKDSKGQILHIPLGTLVFMYGLYIVAVIPAAFVNCYKQKKLKQVNLDVMWSFFWTGMWQVVWGVLLYPLDWVPWPTPTGHNEATPSHTTQDLKDSWTCFMGTNPKPSITTCDSEPAYLWFAAYLLLNVFFNLLFLWLIKRLSGTWAAIGSILCGNLGGFFSQYELFVGKSAAALTLEQWMALVLSSIAMWVYNIEDETDINGISVYGKNERGDHRYDSHGPLGLQPDPDEYASENEPTAQDHTVL
ncbi:unnamed protein product [Effrenium voratum]|uniref:Uncharacterized protein n=2 Tax=Effrenium voratum TaxID=2562239 RepID=A0AA36N514_9DINO|nr:unnamed protein product [Effrenium voratum]